MNQFTKDLYRKINQKETEKFIVQYIYNQLDAKILSKNYLEVDQILSELIVEKLSNAELTAVLTITLSEQYRLETRYAFYKDTEKLLVSRIGQTKTQDILKGL